MFFKTCLTLVLFFACISAQGGQVTETYPHDSVLKAGNFKLYWKMNSTTIVFEIHANTSGWASIGFSKDGLMFPGDVVIGYVSADGKGHLTAGDTHVIWAYGDVDPATGNPRYHLTNRGSAVLQLVDTGVAVGK